MNAFGTDGKFACISQRVASTYVRMLREFCPVGQQGLSPDQQDAVIAAQADLHAFFQSLYGTMYESPDLFGLPVTEDVLVVVDHAKEGPNKTAIKQKLDKPRKLIDEGLWFLRSLALNGRLVGQTLVIGAEEPALAFLKNKPGKAWAHGLAAAGLALTGADCACHLSSERFPQMLPALRALAQASAACGDPDLGRVFFARCDFQALKADFSVDPLDLYCMFKPEEYAWAAEQHVFFTERGYKPQVELGRMFSWVVKYQGKRSIKGSPLFQIGFDERMLRQMRVGIKCAAAFRIVPLVMLHSQALQDDFMRRVNKCGDCHWCDTRPHLGPTEITYKGETHKICWYVNGDLTEISPESAALVKEYALLHEALE